MNYDELAQQLKIAEIELEVLKTNTGFDIDERHKTRRMKRIHDKREEVETLLLLTQVQL